MTQQFADDPEAIPGSKALRKAIVRAYDSDAHTADVQIVGSHPTLIPSVRVATDIPAADVVAGRQCTVLFLDPSNQDDAVVITIQGANPSTPSGATVAASGTVVSETTFGQAASAGAASPYSRGDHTHGTPADPVPAHAAVVDAHAMLAAANTWAALQTFNAGLKLAAGQAIKDSGGAARYTPATSSPHNLFTGDVRVNGFVGIDTAPGSAQKLNISPIETGVTAWTGVSISPSLTLSGSSRNVSGLRGAVAVLLPGSTSGHTIFGLDFTASLLSDAAASAAANLKGVFVRPSILSFESSADLTVDDMAGVHVQPAIVQIFGTIDVTTFYQFRAEGLSLSNADITIPTAYGLKLADLSGTSFTTVYLAELGPATPYLRLLGGADPAANKTNLYLKEQTTLRRVQWKDGASIGAGDKVMVLV